MFALVALFLVVSSATAYDYSADIGLNIIELATQWGYPIESHDLQTEDGYLLTMHRIPPTEGTTSKGPILLMHGLLSSSADWINLGPGKSLGLILADLGYDVWLGNARGNTWSRKHITLDPDTDAEKFFDFSWNEIGYYDLPAKIDHILNMTGTQQVFYVGHSQGTTSFFVMASSRPEYNEKIKLMQAFAPIAYMGHIPNPTFRVLLQDYDQVLKLVDILKWNEILPHLKFFENAGSICITNPSVCLAFLNSLVGVDDLVSLDFLPVMTSNAPAGASIKQVIHYFQEIKSGYFRQYDHGAEENQNRYGQDTPPDYETTKITAPVSLYYGDNDYMAAVEDVERLASEIPNAQLKEVSDKMFNHLEFIWADNAADILYNVVIDELESFARK